MAQLTPAQSIFLRAFDDYGNGQIAQARDEVARARQLDDARAANAARERALTLNTTEAPTASVPIGQVTVPEVSRHPGAETKDKPVGNTSCIWALVLIWGPLLRTVMM